MAIREGQHARRAFFFANISEHAAGETPRGGIYFWRLFGAEDRPEGYLKARLTRDLSDATIPIRSSPSAFAVGTRRTVVDNACKHASRGQHVRRVFFPNISERADGRTARGRRVDSGRSPWRGASPATSPTPPLLAVGTRREKVAKNRFVALKAIVDGLMPTADAGAKAKATAEDFRQVAAPIFGAVPGGP